MSPPVHVSASGFVYVAEDVQFGLQFVQSVIKRGAAGAVFVVCEVEDVSRGAVC